TVTISHWGVKEVKAKVGVSWEQLLLSRSSRSQRSSFSLRTAPHRPARATDPNPLGRIPNPHGSRAVSQRPSPVCKLLPKEPIDSQRDLILHRALTFPCSLNSLLF